MKAGNQLLRQARQYDTGQKKKKMHELLMRKSPPLVISRCVDVLKASQAPTLVINFYGYRWCWDQGVFDLNWFCLNLCDFWAFLTKDSSTVCIERQLSPLRGSHSLSAEGTKDKVEQT